jgi:hypothetical protein
MRISIPFHQPIAAGVSSGALASDAAYLLAQSANERERLRLQAEVWVPATGRLLDAVGVDPDWHCLDLGCGAPGALARWRSGSEKRAA